MNPKNTAVEPMQLPITSANPNRGVTSARRKYESLRRKALGSTSYARVCVLPWRASMVGKRNSPVRVSKKAAMRFPSADGGAAPASAPAAWCSGGLRCAGLGGAVRTRGGKYAGRKKGLPRSPIYRGGVVTGAVTTPPGSPAALQLYGLCVATQMRV